MLVILTVKHRYMQDLIRVHSYRAYNHPFAIPCYSSTGDSEFLEKRQTKLHIFIYLFFFLMRTMSIIPSCSPFLHLNSFQEDEGRDFDP